jgi:hypothetical protein
MAARQGRSEREVETYAFRYVEAPSDARTKLAAFFTILLACCDISYLPSVSLFSAFSSGISGPATSTMPPRGSVPWPCWSS